MSKSILYMLLGAATTYVLLDSTTNKKAKKMVNNIKHKIM